MANETLAEQLEKLKVALSKWEIELDVYSKWALQNDGVISVSEQQEIERRKTEIVAIRTRISQIEKAKGLQTSQTAPVQDNSKKAAEIGITMVDNPEYQRGFAYLPFKGPVTGKQYKKGDKIDPQDSKAVYGSEKGPTWCNQFAMDLAGQVMGKENDPFRFLDKGYATTGKMNEYFNDRDDVFEEVSDMEKAWEAANSGKLVYLSDSGHVATCIPTKELQTRTDKQGKSWKFGEVVQAGASVGKMYLNYAWSIDSFSKIEIFVCKNNGTAVTGGGGNGQTQENNGGKQETTPTENVNNGIKPSSTLGASVGSGGTNKNSDVLLVQQLLNKSLSAGLNEDGKIGTKTISAIKEFQQKNFGWADGRIDSGGQSWGKLSENQNPIDLKALYDEILKIIAKIGLQNIISGSLADAQIKLLNQALNLAKQWLSSKIDALILPLKSAVETIAQQAEDYLKKHASDNFPKFDKEVGLDVPKIYQQTNTSCKTTSEEMVNAFFKNKGISGYEVAPFSGEGYVSIVKEDKSKKNEIIGTDGKAYDSLENNALDLQDTKDEAMDYVNEHLDSGIPVVVGVDHTYNAVLPSQKTAVGNGGSDKDVTGYNSDKTTDHFIVITGKGFDAEKNLPYYTYNDPGYRDKSGNLNRLYPKTIDGNTFWVDEDDSSSATAADGSARRYVLSAVCKYKNGK